MKRTDKIIDGLKEAHKIEMGLQRQYHELMIKARKVGLDELEEDMENMKEQELKHIGILSKHIKNLEGKNI